MKELNEQLAKKVQAVYDALAEAEAFADEHQLRFRLELAYGMGGSYDGKRKGSKNEWGEESDGWFASSQSC